ncbi:MAG: MBL fold metallo-hydrolase [Actinomycetota bacterium]|nr:MBL fold metallo-hydrolase [Actinomycetota bacterium]
MCDDTKGLEEAALSFPRQAPGPAVDPVHLEPVDEVTVTVLVDNFYDALAEGGPGLVRPGFGAGVAYSGQFEGGRTHVGLVAEHGFSALVSVRRGSERSTILFDTGLSPDAMVTNAGRVGVEFEDVQAVVLSHGHFDHAGGLEGLARRRGRKPMPMVIHPLVWTRRRLAVPGGGFEMPTLSRKALQGEGFEIVERRFPSLLAEAGILITGEVDRTTEFERGMPPAHQHWVGTGWEHDPLVLDDQALVVNVRDRGLVVVTGCGHAGVVNIVRHAMRLTGERRLFGLFGGFHLGGKAFEPNIAPTVESLAEIGAGLLVPGHCTGWRAQHALAAAFPDTWVQSSAGSAFTVQAGAGS